jgi:hypothetical protein
VVMAPIWFLLMVERFGLRFTVGGHPIGAVHSVAASSARAGARGVAIAVWCCAVQKKTSPPGGDG